MRIEKKEGSQMTIMHYDLEKIVKDDHVLRGIEKTISFRKISHDYHDLAKGTGRKGYGVEVGIRGLFLQFYYDLSDRQIAERLRYDMAFRWFCGFKIDDPTPEHSYFSRIRKYLGTKKIGKIFDKIRRKAESKGIARKVFTFVDASAIKTKETTWAERDKAIKESEEALNNANVEKYSADKDARFGCKGKNKFWYGYKKHTSVDMGSGLITNVAVTPANITDQERLRYICPDGGMVFGDKSYCLSTARMIMRMNNCHSGAIMKNNMRLKNKDKDKWLTKVRAPFENVFSKADRRTRYRGIAKVQMQAFMEAIVYNVKRLLVIGSPPLFELGV